MFNVYHYYHWSNGHHIVVATSQVLGGGYTVKDEVEAAKCFVPMSNHDSLDNAIAESRKLAKQIKPHREFMEYQSTTPTLDGTAILFALRS